MLTNEENKKRKSEPTKSSRTGHGEKVYYKKTQANAEVRAQGIELINAMNDDEYKKIGSKADTLHFIALLGLASKKTNSNISRRKENTPQGIEVKVQTKDFPTTIGVRLKTDIDIERVPFLKNEIDENGLHKVTKNKDTGIEPEQDFEYKTVKAGDIFDLTMYEFMYLIIRDEYGGYLKVDVEDFYARLFAKLPAFWRGDAKLPTPTIVFESGKGNTTAKGTIIDIDMNNDGNWSIKPEFSQRFKPIFDLYQSRRKRKTKNSNSNHNNTNTKSEREGINLPILSLHSLALQEELGMLESSTSRRISSVEELFERGKEIVLSLNESRRKLLGRKSSTLHIINELGFAKGFGVRPIGITLFSDEEMEVPVIDILRDIKTGIYPSTDILYRTVPAGQSFIVSNYEFMYLILRDEYAGYCEFGGDNYGAYLVPNFKLYFEGKNKLPVPNLKYSNNEKPAMVDIFRTTEDGIKEIKPEYSEKFGALLE